MFVGVACNLIMLEQWGDCAVLNSVRRGVRCGVWGVVRCDL